MIGQLFLLLCGHALADFALQTDSMAYGKNRHNKPKNVPEGQEVCKVWVYWLSSHSFIHGGMVYLITGSITLGIIETIVHWFIDFAKCENWTNIHTDQALHVLCKVLYLV
jgi:hypothetical protein